MKQPAILFASVAALSLAACVGTPAAYEAHAVQQADGHRGYLSASELQALAANVGAPPAAGSAEEAADKAQSQTYRALENTDRWLLASSHAEVRLPFALQHFDCTLGVAYDPTSNKAPVTARLLHKLFIDGEAASTIVKLRAHRARPVGDDPQRLACQRISPAGRASASYPSGTATVAATYGQALAQVDPSRAAESIEMGHQIAISRAICGLHYPSDIEVGEALGKAVFEAASKTEEYKADLALAQAELAALRQSGATNPGCAAERLALSQTVAPHH